MSTDDYLKDVREFYESFNEMNTRAWELQQEFYREFGERQSQTLVALSEERINSLKQLPEIETPAQLFEMSVKLDESARARLTQFHDDTKSALEKHYNDLAAVYAPKKPAPAKRSKAVA